MYAVYSAIRREQEIWLTIIFHAKVRTAGTDVDISYGGAADFVIKMDISYIITNTTGAELQYVRG